MKRWIQRTLVGVLGASVLFGGLAACSHRPHGWGSMNEADAAQWREKMVDRVASKLDLDAAQKAKLSALGEAMRTQRQAMMPAGQDPRAEFSAVIAGTTFDRAKAQALVDGKTGAVREGSPKVIAAAADFYDSLKPEQQQKVREFLNKRGHGWRG